MNNTSRKIASLVILITIGIVCCATPGWSAPDSDTTEVGSPPPARNSAADYIFWPFSTALKLPWWTLSQIISQPIRLVENQSLLPTIEEHLAFAKKWGAYPVVNYKSTSGLAGGFGFDKRDFFTQGVGLKVKATYSTFTCRYASLRLGGENFGDRRFGFSGEIGWRADTRERFFGIGPDADLEERTNYGRRGPFGSLNGHLSLFSGLNLQGFLAWHKVEPEDGRWRAYPHRRVEIDSMFADQNLFGLFDALEFAEYGLGLQYDWRQRRGSPLGGGIVQLRTSYITGDAQDETKIGFWKTHAEASWYLNLFRGRVIGLRVLAERTDPDEGTRIPFYQLAQMGGFNSLRGYTGGRFTDRDLLSFTVEYRWPLWRRLDAYLFTDQGRVFYDLIDDFEFSNFRSSYGGGFRLWRDGGHAGITFARSAETFKFYLRLGS